MVLNVLVTLVFAVSSNVCMVLRVISVEYEKVKKVLTFYRFNGIFVTKR